MHGDWHEERCAQFTQHRSGHIFVTRHTFSLLCPKDLSVCLILFSYNEVMRDLDSYKEIGALCMNTQKRKSWVQLTGGILFYSSHIHVFFFSSAGQTARTHLDAGDAAKEGETWPLRGSTDIRPNTISNIFQANVYL